MSEQATTTDPVMPEAKLNLVRPNAPVTGRVVSNDMCLKSKANVWVRHTEIDVSGTPLEGNFLVGQSFGVIAPGVDDNGKPHKVRLYSVAVRLRAPRRARARQGGGARAGRGGL